MADHSFYLSYLPKRFYILLKESTYFLNLGSFYNYRTRMWKKYLGKNADAVVEYERPSIFLYSLIFQVQLEQESKLFSKPEKGDLTKQKDILVMIIRLRFVVFLFWLVNFGNFE